ncbi:four helix bundle protein [Parvicella tangerina]|uniref:Four helix bundle protein n=1 Tax=Parvicella tangerina TaxID=2829795 RepID=A0A916JPQ9_9FLAO|nr:four helix bundle protein [Parvicella tangerina]CAG5083316.1 hypothetical protein CRYO30217_02160 [Parvicella tangerina]
MHNFRELKIWKESMELAHQVNTVCSDFPDHEKYGLTSQLRRASVSVPSNISEGSSRKSTKDFIRFLRIAMGSSFEMETQLLLAVKCGYLEDDHEVLDLNNKVQRMIWNFIEKLNHDEKNR